MKQRDSPLTIKFQISYRLWFVFTLTTSHLFIFSSALQSCSLITFQVSISELVFVVFMQQKSKTENQNKYYYYFWNSEMTITSPSSSSKSVDESKRKCNFLLIYGKKKEHEITINLQSTPEEKTKQKSPLPSLKFGQQSFDSIQLCIARND